MKGVWNRRTFPVLLAYFLDNFGLAIVYPIFTPLFLRPRFDFFGGADFSLFHKTILLGLLIASFPLAQLIGAPLFGGLSDRYGRKRIFFMTISGGILGYLLTGLGVHFREIHLLWSGRLIAGFFAGNLPLCLATITDHLPIKKERSRHFGYIAAVGGIGFIFAILAAGSLSLIDPELPFFLTSLLLCLNLILIQVYFKEDEKSSRRDKLKFIQGLKNLKRAVSKTGIWSIYFIYFLFLVAWLPSIQFLSAYIFDIYPTKQAHATTAIFFGVAISWSFANFVLNPFLSKQFAPKKIFIFSLLFMGIFFFLSLIRDQPKLLFLTHFFFATLFAALCSTNGLTLLSLSGAQNKQGSVLGLSQSVAAFALIVGPIIGGFLAGIDIHKLYLFTGSCSLAGAFLLWRKA